MSPLTAVLAYSLDTDLTLNQIIHCVHMETEGEETAPDKVLLHSHPLSVLIELFLLLSASAHTNYSILLPTGTAPRCRGHPKSSISQLAIKCLVNLQRCLSFLFPHTVVCAVSLTLCSRNSQSHTPGSCLCCPTNLAWVDTGCCH